MALAWVAVLGWLPACGGEPEPSDGVPEPFFARDQDFEGFGGWHRFEIEGAAIPEGHEPGPAFVYANDLPPDGVRRFPVGTILVKTIETGSAPDWAVHAMVKRGDGFNAAGAVGWEFLELSLSADGTPTIVWRGEGPPSGRGYGAATVDASAVDGGLAPLVCNDCHAAAWTNDSVLTPQLALGE